LESLGPDLDRKIIDRMEGQLGPYGFPASNKLNSPLGRLIASKLFRTLVEECLEEEDLSKVPTILQNN
jgi:hypothetical protein